MKDIEPSSMIIEIWISDKRKVFDDRKALLDDNYDNDNYDDNLYNYNI